MNRCRRATWALAAGLALALTTGTPAAGAPPSPAAGPRLGLISQTFNVAADGTLQLVVALPASVNTAALADATMVVGAYRAVDSREAVQAAVDGELPPSVDTVDLRLADLPPPSGQQLSVSVPLEARTRTSEALQLPAAGVYPLVVEVRSSGEVLAELTTFVHRLPDGDDPFVGDLPVAMAMATTSAVHLDDSTEVVLDDATMAELTHLADVLEAVAIPVSAQVPPALLDALARGDDTQRALEARISAALNNGVGHDALSLPSLPLDPSTAAAAGETDLYTEWLRDGEDLLATTTNSSARRTTRLIPDDISQGGARLLRDLGTRLLVMPVSVYDYLPGTFGGFTDSTQLVQLDVGGGVTVDLAVVDRFADDRLAQRTTTPTLTSIIAVADLLAAREQIVQFGGDPRRHGLTLATPDLTLPNTETAGAITALIADTPGLRPMSLDDLGVRTDQLLFDGQEVVVGLPDAVQGDLLTRTALAGALRVEAAATASMLPDGDPRPAGWTRLIDLIPTEALADDQVTRIAAELRAEYTAIRGAVVPPDGFSFSLTGRSSEIPLKIQNTGDTTLTVVVRLSSPKLLFPEGDQVVQLLPGQSTEVRIPIEARSNGKFPVTLEVLTPIGNVRLGAPVQGTARVTALAGLGNLFTFAALLMVATWWVRHVRQNRRKRSADTAFERHPASRPPADQYPRAESESGGTSTGTAAVIDDSGLSPDAATSTLPPS